MTKCDYDDRRMCQVEYHVVTDDVLVAEHNLLPCEDGSLRPGLECSLGSFNSILHLFLCGLGHKGDDLERVTVKIYITLFL